MTQPATPLLSEPGQIRVLKVICILVCVLSVSCVHGGEGSPLALLSTNTPPQTISPEMTQQSNSNEIKRAALLREALQYADKQAEDRAHGVPLPPSEFPFPAPDAGPHRPPPSYVNLYGIKDNYPNYLECIYDVDEKNTINPKIPNGSLNHSNKLAILAQKGFLPLDGSPSLFRIERNTKTRARLSNLLKLGPFSKPATCLIPRATCRNWLPMPIWTGVLSFLI